MKKIIVISLFLFSAIAAKTQQTAQFSNYLFNHFGHHPAIAGWRDCFEFRVGFRTQWLNFPGAPKTAFANFHTSLTRKKKGFLKSKHGIGANIESDQMGPFGSTRIQLAYAYHIPFNRKYKMSMGLFAGMQQFKIDVGKLNINTNQDPAVTGKNFAYLYPDVWPSIFFYSKDEFAGFTIRQAFRNKIKKITQDSRLRYHYVITAGKRFPFGPNRSVIPSFCFKWASVSAMEIDINAMFEFGTRFQLGASWRNTDALIGMARLNIKNYSIGYAFDFTTSKIKLASSNTHEIIVGINTCKPDKRNSAECYSFN